jgi:hypothetical protein
VITWTVLPGPGASALDAAPTEGSVHPVPDRIAHDCSSDVTPELLRWIASVPDDSVLLFARGGCYRLDGSLRIENRSQLVFDGNGATFRAVADGDRDRRHIWFLGGRELVVRNLEIRGANPKAGASPEAYVAGRAFQHAFAFEGVAGGMLDHVRASDVYGDFVYVGAGEKGRWSRDIRVTRSRFERSGRQGIAVTAGENVVIEHNTIRDVARSMFDLEPNNPEGGARNVRITSNVTGAAKNMWLASKGEGNAVGDVTITGNVMKKRTGALVWVFGSEGGYRGPFLIEHNRFLVGDTVNDEGSRGAFFLARCSDVTIRDNKAYFPAGHDVPAVELRRSKQVSINANKFKGAGQLVVGDGAKPHQ